MRVRLIRKLADEIDGVHLVNHEVNDVIDLPDRKARLLVLEGWAVEDRRAPGPLRIVAFRRSNDLGHLFHEDDDVSKAG